MIWLVGAGPMAIDYCKVMQTLCDEFTVIGRGERSAGIFEDNTGIKPVTGGLDAYISTTKKIPEKVVVAVGVDQLYSIVYKLLDFGVKKILVEKPGILIQQEADELLNKMKSKDAEIYVAYNRRFYQSVQEAQRFIESDGGVTSFHFEFTERSYLIESLEKPDIVKDYWFLANSTHVVDLAFYLCGSPKTIICETSGELSWHKRSAVFAGSGVSEHGALFSYFADWTSAGRWSVEVLTAKRRLILRPLERLQVQLYGEMEIREHKADYSLEENYKPGLYKQVDSFVNDDVTRFCTLEGQKNMLPVYNRMASYNDDR